MLCGAVLYDVEDVTQARDSGKMGVGCATRRLRWKGAVIHGERGAGEELGSGVIGWMNESSVRGVRWDVTKS